MFCTVNTHEEGSLYHAFIHLSRSTPLCWLCWASPLGECSAESAYMKKMAGDIIMGRNLVYYINITTMYILYNYNLCCIIKWVQASLSCPLRNTSDTQWPSPKKNTFLRICASPHLTNIYVYEIYMFAIRKFYNILLALTSVVLSYFSVIELRNNL